MNLLDRHLFKSVLGTCLAAIALFGLLLIFVNSLRDLLVPLLAGQLGVGIALQLLLILPLTVAQFALPMGILTGVLLTLGRLSADSEVVAMRSAGLSLARIARPIFLLGVVGGVLCLFTNFYFFPVAKVKYERELSAALRRNPLSFIVPKTFIRDFKGCVLYVREKDGPLLRDVWLWELDAQSRVRRVVHAESGRLDFDEATNSLVPRLNLVKAEERDPENPEDFGKSPKAPSVEKTEEVRIALDRHFGQQGSRVKPDWLTYGQLLAERARLAALPPEAAPEKIRAAAVTRMKLELVVHDKFNFALAAFTFAFVAVPLGIQISRRETSANLGIALVLVLGYYLLIVAVKMLDRHPEYRPDLLLWGPNLLFLALGAWLFSRLDRQ